MADDYSVISSVQDIQVLSPTQTLPVTTFGIRTHPHEVVAYINVPQANVDENAATPTLEQYAQLIEVSFQHQGVVGMYWAQDVDTNGLLQDFMVVVVGYNPNDPARPGPFQQEVWLPIADFGNPIGYAHTFAGPVDDAYNRLVAIVNA